jgi:hypothetical protein
VFVYPCGFRWQESAYRSFELSAKIVRWALGSTQSVIPFFGPSEFRVTRPLEPNIWVGSDDAISLLTSYQLSPENVIVFRPWVEKHIEWQAREVHDREGSKISEEERQAIRYIAHLDVVHPSTRTLLFELKAESAPDAPSTRIEEDPTPALTLLFGQLTQTATERLKPLLEGPTAWVNALPPVAFAPQAYFNFRFEGRPSFQATLDELSPEASAEVRRSRIKYLNGELPPNVLEAMAESEGGLWLLADAPTLSLRRGDLVVELDGRPALPEAFERLKFARAPTKGRVRSGPSLARPIEWVGGEKAP